MKKLLAVAAMAVSGLLVVSAEAKTCTWKGGAGIQWIGNDLYAVRDGLGMLLIVR